jgi:hypothetical protein
MSCNESTVAHGTFTPFFFQKRHDDFSLTNLAGPPHVAFSKCVASFVHVFLTKSAMIFSQIRDCAPRLREG